MLQQFVICQNIRRQIDFKPVCSCFCFWIYFHKARKVFLCLCGSLAFPDCTPEGSCQLFGAIIGHLGLTCCSSWGTGAQFSFKVWFRWACADPLCSLCSLALSLQTWHLNFRGCSATGGNTSKNTCSKLGSNSCTCFCSGLTCSTTTGTTCKLTNWPCSKLLQCSASCWGGCSGCKSRSAPC